MLLPRLDLSALTEWFRARTGAFPNRVFESEEGYFSMLEVRRVHRFDLVRYQDAGRVHENIDRAERLERAIHGPADFGGMGHVHAQRERPCSGRFDLPLKLIQECLAPGQARGLRPCG